ncbi:uncharacterized protein LOC120518894 [Polypterus senegalus]|uniref:uncharacterized protein LOC120518894 n=1 Tax=Polypterus senegalus TaxID=55291 RepID=UPI0019656336|nr:uncharacterized protein LOC120518894 [Polypterus senegalus]
MRISEFCLLVCLTAVRSLAQNEEKPKVTLKISKEKKPVYVGDTVTLECSINSDKSDSTGWKYVWYKNGQVSSRVQQIEEVTVTQAGRAQYQCGVQRGDDDSNTYSKRVTLTVLERSVKLELKPDGEIFEGDKISLHCQLDGDPVGWTYEFYNREALQVTLSVSPSSSVKEGDSLNLTCTWTGGKSSALKFAFSFQRNKVTVKNNNTSAVFRIEQADESHAGSYGCAVQLPGGGKSYSNEIEIQVQVDYSTENVIRLGLSGLVLIVLLILVRKYFWFRVLSTSRSNEMACASDQQQ